jgi:hypothetical protein
VNSSIIAHILPSLAIPQCLDLALHLVLCKHLKLLESIENIGFGLNRQHEAISPIVVDESDPIVESREGVIGNFVHVRVDEL